MTRKQTTAAKPARKGKAGAGKPQPSAAAPQPGATKADAVKTGAAKPGKVEEIGGRDGPDPTRYGDWEKDGRCVDF